MIEGVPGGRVAPTASRPAWSQGSGLWSVVRQSGAAERGMVELPATLLLRVQGSGAAASAPPSGVPRDIVSLSDAARQRLAQDVQGRGEPTRGTDAPRRAGATVVASVALSPGPTRGTTPEAADPPGSPRGEAATEPPAVRSRSGAPARVDVIA